MINIIKKEIEIEGLTLTHIRNVPVDSEVLGEVALAAEPDV